MVQVDEDPSQRYAHEKDMIEKGLCLQTRRHLTATGDHDGTPAADGWLCRSCCRRLEQRIAELPERYVWLHMNLARGGSAGQLVSGSREIPIPINLTVVALLTWPAKANSYRDGPISADGTPSIPAVMYDWVRLMQEEFDLAGPRRTTVDVMAVWLIARMREIVKRRWVIDFAEDLNWLHSVINATAPRWPRKEKPQPVPCSGCGLLALMWRPPYIECDARLGGCSRLYLASEYDDLVAQWVVWTQGQQEVAV